MSSGVGDRVRVVALGTGSAVGLPPRGHASLLLQLGEDAILVDAPGDAPARLMAAGVDPLDVHTMILTHHHEDHWNGLPGLLVHRLVRRRFGVALRPGESPGEDGPPLRVLAPVRTAEFLERLLDLIDRRTLVEIVPFDDGDPPLAIGSGGWTAEPIAGDHGSMPVVGFVARRGGGGRGLVIAYSSDTAPVDRFLRASAGSDLLVHECQTAAGAPPAHTDAAGLVAALDRLAGEGVAMPRRLAAMHIAAWPEDEAAEIRRTLVEGLPESVTVLVPDDGAVLIDRG